MGELELCFEPSDGRIEKTNKQKEMSASAVNMCMFEAAGHTLYFWFNHRARPAQMLERVSCGEIRCSPWYDVYPFPP